MNLPFFKHKKANRGKRRLNGRKTLRLQGKGPRIFRFDRGLIPLKMLCL